MQETRHLLIRQSSHLRAITEPEAVGILSPEEQRNERLHVAITTDHFRDAIDQGEWNGQDTFLREHATTIKNLAEKQPLVQLHYLGLAEVPHIIALGAHIGGERTVDVHDHNRDTGDWQWAHHEQTITIETRGIESVQREIRVAGHATIRVSISAFISDTDVRAAVGDQTLADLTITHQEPTIPAVGLIKSAADVAAVRQAVRSALAAIQNACPNLDEIHLFVAAPPSVCFTIGQELVLRNSVPIQTYRYRPNQEAQAQQPAILLTAAGEERPITPPTQEERALAGTIRQQHWPAALAAIENYVSNRQTNHQTAAWLTGHPAATVLKEIRCYATLPPPHKLIRKPATVDPQPYAGDFGYDQERKHWQLGDHLLIGLSQAVNADQSQLQQLIRLFLFHEYLHLHQGITKYTADGVGTFANCLEYLDYQADAYAIFLQWDLMRYQEARLLDLDQQFVRDFLADQVELAINSFWAFDTAAGDEWQVRRLRRYCNWYWRLTQLRRTANIRQSVMLLARHPKVELGGLRQYVSGRRIIAALHRRDQSTPLELAIVLENDRLYRHASHVGQLLEAFRQHKHEALKDFFCTVYDTAAPDGVQPQPLELENT